MIPLDTIICGDCRKEIEELRAELAQMRADMGQLILGQAALKVSLEQAEARLALEAAQDRKRISTLEANSRKIPMIPKGAKTEARLKKLEEILREKGSCSYRELERLLRISPKEMNRLVSRLDNREYEVFTRNGDDRQKVLRKKVQINAVNNLSHVDKSCQMFSEGS
jgi:hypothetical protein